LEEQKRKEKKMRVKELMKSARGRSTSINVNEEESIDNAALLMKNNNLSQISVVNDDDKVVGVVTKDSILQASDDLNEDFFLD
jgi:predicted transcriptional regulator